MSALLNRLSYCLHVPSCPNRHAVVYGKQLATWSDSLKRWHSSPKSEKEQPTTESVSEPTKDSSSDDGAGDNTLSQLVAERDETIEKQKAELEELNV